MVAEIERWLKDPNALALKMSSGELSGFFSKGITIPPNTFAFIETAEGAHEIIKGEYQSPDEFVAILVKDGDLGIHCQIEDIRTQDDFGSSLEAEIRLRFAHKALFFSELENNLLDGRRLLRKKDLLAYLQPHIKEVFTEFIGGWTAEDLYKYDFRDQLGEAVKKALAGPTFEAALVFGKCRSPSFLCPEYERLRDAGVKVRVEAEEIEQKKKLEELKEELEKKKALREKEVDEFARILAAQGIEQELELKSELDKKRRDGQMNKFQELVDNMGGDSAKAMIFLLENEKVKADLIERLIERGMTPEQIEAKKTNELEKRVSKQIESFQQIMAEHLKLDMGPTEGPKTRRVLVVLGKQILGFDPSTNISPEAPKEIYDLGNKGLGYLRSVRTAHMPELEDSGRVRTILAGAQRGVYAIQDFQTHMFEYPTAPSGRGGTNSVAYWDDHVYVSHSELGIFRWDVQRISKGESMFVEETHGQPTTRGLQITLDGWLFFTTGPNIYGHNLSRGKTRQFRGTRDNITAMVVTEDEVIAGDSEGRIFIWKRDDPGSPRQLGVRKSNAIYMLKAFHMSGAQHLLIGAKTHSITSVRLGDDIANEYRAPEEIRWVDGASDCIYGVSRSGFTLHVWEFGKYRDADFRIRLADRVQDLWVVRDSD